MKTIYKTLGILLILLTTVKIQAQDTATKNLGIVNKTVAKQLHTVLLTYYDLKDALVATNAKQAKEFAAALEKKLNETDTSLMTVQQKKYFLHHRSVLLLNTKAIAASMDIEAQRTAFESISHSIYAVIKSFKANKVTVYLQYCPMALSGKGAFWLSDEETVMNPFFGSKMLHCGSVEAKF